MQVLIGLIIFCGVLYLLVKLSYKLRFGKLFKSLNEHMLKKSEHQILNKKDPEEVIENMLNQFGLNPKYKVEVHEPKANNIFNNISDENIYRSSKGLKIKRLLLEKNVVRFVK